MASRNFHRRAGRKATRAGEGRNDNPRKSASSAALVCSWTLKPKLSRCVATWAAASLTGPGCVPKTPKLSK